MDDMSIFDFLPEEEAQQYRKLKSTDWKWTMANDYPKEKNGLKVFSCFACGGGSTMGYKLAGCDVVGCCEIDPRMNEVYIKNHNPKYNFLMDIRKFNETPNDELPEELFNLDILDGSPPCTTFSMAGEREESWGKKKKFREGQAEQTLDDLSFIFIETASKLQPKFVIMENVEGLIRGEAWRYVQRIYKQFNDIGYRVKHWLLKGEHMGIPQRRHRVFFIAVRHDLHLDVEKLDLAFNYEPITYGDIKAGSALPLGEDTDYRRLTIASLPTEKNIGEVNLRVNSKVSGFNTYFVDEDSVVPTLRCKADLIDRDSIAFISNESMIHAQTFPEEFDFCINSRANIAYVCGMSVPPIMIKRIVTRLIESGVFGENKTPLL